MRDAFPTATILRPSIVFGPEDDFFNRFAAMAMVSPVLPLIGGGETRFQPVYVGDVAEAAVRALDDPAAAGRTYELGGPKIYTFRALLELMLAEMRRKRWFVDLPFPVATAQAYAMSLLPRPPLDPRPGRDAAARQRRVVRRADLGHARHRARRGRGDPARLSRALPQGRLVWPPPPRGVGYQRTTQSLPAADLAMTW